MNFKPVLAAALVAAFCSSTVMAAEPQEVRQQEMKAGGEAFGAMAAIAKGQKPYDAAVVKASLEKLAEVSKDFHNLFPKGSETGYESEASIKIWEDSAGFKAANDKFAADVASVLAALPADQAGVTAAVGTIGANCGACHQTYRVKR